MNKKMEEAKMEREYYYEGIVDIEQVLVEAYKRGMKKDGYFKAISKHTARALELHNKGLSALEIANRIGDETDNKSIQSGRVKDWLRRVGVKPNRDSKMSYRNKEYKLLSKEFYEKVVSKRLSGLGSNFDIVMSYYGGTVQYVDGTFGKVNNSAFVVNNLMRKADNAYIFGK